MTTAEIKIWNETVGVVALPDGEVFGYFEFEPKFLDRGLQLAPLQMPLGRGVFRFPGLALQSFHGLPGMLADCLPDKFGNALIDAWVARERRPNLNAVERLCYTGTRGMGALEFFPPQGPVFSTSEAVDVSALVQLASDVLTNRRQLQGSMAPDQRSAALRDILRVGTSAGGARAKAVLAWNPMTDELRSGQVNAGDGFEHWLLKFDGVAANTDHGLSLPQGFGAIEYAYFLMARAAGVEMSECRLLEENERRHFMTKRFDRGRDGEKLHMQSLGALEHLDFNVPGAGSYEGALWTISKLGLSMDTKEQMFRRMVFNVVARNQDDHVKNIAFIMNQQGEWSLAPAYDVTYSYNPQSIWTAQHQMSINGKRDGFTAEDFEAVARGASMHRGRAAEILEEVTRAVSRWSDYAWRAGVAEDQASAIQATFRTHLLGRETTAPPTRQVGRSR